MDHKSTINQKYSELCTKLGDLTFRRDNLNDEIRLTVEAMSSLNTAQGVLSRAEAAKPKINDGAPKTEDGNKSAKVVAVADKKAEKLEKEESKTSSTPG